MAVAITGPVRRRRLRRRRLASRARTVLETIGHSRAELSIALVDDETIRALNRDYRGKDRATDVLAFSLLEGEGAGTSDAIGDVVISVETAIRQATEIGHDLEAEIDRLLVHGILHLVGYDHERSETEARRMRRKERQCLAALDSAGRGSDPARRPSGQRGGTR